MTRHNIITLFTAVVLPTLTWGVGIGLIKSANQEVRSLFQTPAATNSFLQCFVDQSRAAFPISQQPHLRTVTDVIRSFVRKRTITDTDALMFQTEVASSLVDVVVNEPSRPEDYAWSLDVLVRVLRDCYLRSTGKTTKDLIAVVETFTKLFVDVIVNVGKSPTSLKISEEDQRLLHTLQEVEKFGQVNEPYGISLGSEIRAKSKTGYPVSAVFQSDNRKPSGIIASIGKQSSADAIANLPLSPIPSNPILPILNASSINTANLNDVNTVSINSTKTAAAVDKPFLQSQPGISTNSFLLQQINNGNSNSAIDPNFNHQSIMSSSATIPKTQVPTQTIGPSTLVATNPQNVQASINKGNERIIRNNFPELVKKDLSNRRVTRSISNFPVDQNLNNIFFNTSIKKSNQSDVKTNFKQKLIMSTVKKLIKSGNEQIILDLMKHVAFKENVFEPKFLNQTKEQASELLMNTITSLPMASTLPTFIGQFQSTILSPEYIDYVSRTLYDNAQGTAQLKGSDSQMTTFVKAFIDSVVNFLTPFSSKHTMDIKRKKRDTAIDFPQDSDQQKFKNKNNPPSAQASSAVVSDSSDFSDGSSSSVIVPADNISNDSFKIDSPPQTYPTVSETLVSSAAFTEANSNTKVDNETMKGNINSFLLEYSSKKETSDSGESSIPPAPEKIERRQPPAVVSEFASAFSKAVAASEAITAAVGLTLHGPTADNAIYDIMFETLSEKGASDPSIGSRLDNSSYPSASNFDGVTPLVLTNALSAAVADALLDEKLLTFESIPTIIASYIQILEETLDQFEVNDDPKLNSKALVIGTEKFISSRGISVLHGATELASHFKEDFIYAWEEILNNRPKNYAIPDTKDKETDEPKLKCKADPSNPESFSRYLLNELSQSNSMQGLFLLPQMTNDTAAAFYQSFYSAALSLGINIPKPDSDLIWKVLSDNLDTKSPVFFATIYAVSLERFLCQKGVLKGQNSLPLSRLFAEVLNRAPSVSTSNRKPEDYFDQLINATFHFLISLLVIKPTGSLSWTSNFLSELTSTSPVTLPKLIREVAPEILSPSGLGHPDATKRIFDLTVALSQDVLSPYNPTIDVPSYAERLKVIKSQIRESNPALKPIGLRLGTFLEGISGIVTLINAAVIPALHVEVGNSSSVQREFLNVLPSLL
ncbi:hypothetical protein JTE90_003230 [Oedothorax gibbosus]|uniref:Spidroin N-terminal domain-containing protein n=1 Tax=Oedothorax gibbosus TaxID=931172 RepID=A0AAV6UN70_9ARAC|nr:hypothetical protein JTE90_003230 [Oedothorax gibbosus]